MDLDLARESFTVKCGSHKDFRELEGSATLYLLKVVLFDDVCHLLLLSFTLRDLLLEIGDLLRNGIESATIRGAIRYGADEGGIGIFKRLS